MSAEHGYIAYTHGCRCQVCKASKAAYMRERRAKARQRQGAVPAHIAHGTRHAYEEHGCRCYHCRIARTAAQRRAA